MYADLRIGLTVYYINLLLSQSLVPFSKKQLAGDFLKKKSISGSLGSYQERIRTGLCFSEQSPAEDDNVVEKDDPIRMSLLKFLEIFKM